jgi:hypothetical protein
MQKAIFVWQFLLMDYSGLCYRSAEIRAGFRFFCALKKCCGVVLPSRFIRGRADLAGIFCHAL